MTSDQIRTAFENLTGLSAREADVQVVEMLGGTPEVLAEYVWDHWMGEPAEPTIETLTSKIYEVIRP